MQLKIHRYVCVVNKYLTSSKTHHVYFNVLFSFKTTVLLNNTKSSCIIAYSPTTQAIYLPVLPFLRYAHRYKSSCG